MLNHIVTSVSKYDDAFVVWADGEIAIGHGTELAKRYSWIRPLIRPMLQRSQEGDGGVGAGNEARRGTATVELMRLQGRPSIAGVVPIPDLSRSIEGRTLFLVAYRYLDGPALDALSREQGLNGARFARSSDPEHSEVSFQIEATASGEPIGFIIWTPDLPGSKVIVSMIPALGASALMIVGLFLVLVLLLRRALADLRDSEQTARHRSLHDILTDLPNRGLFATRLEECLRHANLSDPATTIALLDLDRFKAVNDTLGHAAGDELIRAVSARISGMLRPGDTLARLGGDEFALLLPGGNRSPYPGGRMLCQQIVDELERPFALLGGNATTNIGCSIGFLGIDQSMSAPGEVMHMADIALYQAKTTGRGRCVEYLPGMDSGSELRATLQSDLRAFLDFVEERQGTSFGAHGGIGTIEETGIKVFYQTIHRAMGGSPVSGVEALVRWRHEGLGLLGPDKFIPLAEETGLIHRLGKLVLVEACAAAMHWDDTSFIAVNVSPIQLRRDGFVEEVLQILAATGLPPHRLELEVTETALMGDYAVVAEALSKLRASGIKIALDDFGTGYSSLSHLVRFEVDRIKIDRSFVQMLGTRADGATILSAVIRLGKALGVSTTAEGVETEGQRDFLVASGCTDLQGYYFSRPEPIPAVGALRMIVPSASRP
jgi:diguanylate cyclase (GGDEF)-like protein